MDFDNIEDLRTTHLVKWSPEFTAHDVIPMWVADMDFSIAPSISDALQVHARSANFGYRHRPARLFDSILNWFQQRHQWRIQTDWIVPTPGVIPSIQMAIQSVTNPGEGVIVQTPAYYPFFSSVTTHNRELIINPLISSADGYIFDWQLFEAQLTKASAFLLCNPHNPVGRAWRMDELTKIVELCSKYQVSIISDDIHCDLVFPPNRYMPIPILPTTTDVDVVYCYSPSKSFGLSGLNTAFTVIPNPVLRKNYLSKLHSTGYYWGNSFGDAALEAAYAHGVEWMDTFKVYLSRNIEILTLRLTEIGGIELMPIEATYLAWLDFRATGLSEEEVSQRLSMAKVQLEKGSVFGEDGRGFQRMTIATQSFNLEEALSRISRVF